MVKEQKKSKKKFWILLGLVMFIAFLPLITLALAYVFDENETLSIISDEILNFYYNARRLMIIIPLALIVLHLILMIFYKSARKIWPFIAYIVLLLTTAVIGFIIDYVTEDYTSNRPVSLYGGAAFEGDISTMYKDLDN